MTYHYTMCGLDYVYLNGGVREHDTEYGKGVSIESADILDRQIAGAIITAQTRLRGQEVRFLRSLLHCSQTELGNELGLKRLTIARWENAPDTPIPGPADRALRIVVAREFFPPSMELIAELYPEITDNSPPQRLDMYYLPDHEPEEPSMFPDEPPRGDNWKRVKTAA